MTRSVRHLMLFAALTFGATLAVDQPASAQVTDLKSCEAACRVSAGETVDYPGYFQMCSNNCIEEYDGGTGSSPPGTGTTPIGPNYCMNHDCNWIPYENP